MPLIVMWTAGVICKLTQLSWLINWPGLLPAEKVHHITTMVGLPILGKIIMRVVSAVTYIVMWVHPVV